METFGNQKQAKTGYKFYCESCDYGTCKKSGYDSHILTSKHQKQTNGNILETLGNQKQADSNLLKYACENCLKEFKNRSGLWKHKKICNTKLDIESENGPSDKELIMLLIKENSEFKNIMLKVLENGTTNNSHNNNNNSNNKSFNLQFFLNETCKNAMNITDFVDSLQLQLSDLEKVGEVGYIEGISNIIIKKLNALDISERPIHCTDKKRETMYIRDEDKWEKEDEKHMKLHKMVKNVAYKNINLISEFREKYPDFKKINSKYSDQFNKIIIESMGGKGDNEYEKEEKIIKRVAKEVIVDKII